MKKVTLLSLIIASAFAYHGHSRFNTYTAPQTAVTQPLTTSVNCTALDDNTTSLTVNDETVKYLTQMREEEKLARDVYLTLYNKWNLRVFYNIANAEEKHTTAIKNLLDKYNIPDPVEEVGGDEVGVFENQELQDLYNQLVEKGSQSVTDALTVGCTIEDLDIKDLQDAKNDTNNTDVLTVYENLEKGSRNHMRSFYNLLVSYGGDYEPQYISEDYFNEIISTPIERGPAR